MTPDINALLRQLASTRNKVSKQRDTSLDVIESPTAMLDRLVNDAKSKPMESTTANRWRTEKQDSTSESKELSDSQAAVAPSSQEDDLAAVVAAQNAVQAPPVEKPRKEQSKLSLLADTAQAGLDAIGVADPTPISDGINAAWSVGRAFTDPERRSEHLQNAAISAVSMVPYIGDTAKLLKTGRYAKTASAVTRASQRESYREDAKQLFGDNKPEPSGGGSGNQEPPLPPTGNEPPDAPTPDEAEAVNSFSTKLNDAADSVIKFAGPVAAAYAKMFAFVQGLELLNAGVLALNRELAPYNGQLSAAYAQSDTRDLQRNIRKGDELAGPLSALAEEQSELKDALSKLTNPIQAIAISGLTVMTKMANMLIKYDPMINTMTFALQKIAEWLPDFSKATDPAASAFFRDVSDGKFDGNEPKFGGPPGPL